MTNASSHRRHSLLDVDEAPELPDPYARYSSFWGGSRGGKTKPSPQGDQAIEGFVSLLRRYAGYDELLPIPVWGRGSYGAVGDGEGRWRVKATVAERVSSVLSSPLYSGVAENLRKCLRTTHRRDVSTAYEWLRERGDDAQAVRARVFGGRASACSMGHGPTFRSGLSTWVITLTML
ncbi:hypothetical protein ACWET9_42745 [Streptomyces sp. NPDC004059]